MKEIAPVVGDWYKKPGGHLFEVVAIDESDETIEVQHYDGTVEEIDLEAWKEMLLIEVEPPEDWSGSYDMEREDYGVDLEDNKNDRHGSPLDEFLNS